ncbi:MAG TPA: hypothetical protein PKW55_06555 [Spirochaetota bacterium]|nr:hypothetical protein [Spirochaetota bacterium]HOM38545.1 hypothetical protein [Spirochaetota bacterium]HPQ49085.1 hypothetical protein [Spirochaetota bacterium]
MKNIFIKIILLLSFLFSLTVYSQRNSFEKSIGKTAMNLEPNSFRFSLGLEYGADKWGSGNYSSLIVPISLSLGINNNIEAGLSADYSRPYSLVDGIKIKDKYSYHNLTPTIKLALNPEDIRSKPALGLLFGCIIPTHDYESLKLFTSFLMSSSVGALFSWNFNLGLGWYISKMDYEYNAQTAVRPGLEVNPNIEIGYILSDFLKIATGFDTNIHFLGKKYYTDLSKDMEDFTGFTWITSFRIKPSSLPLVFDIGLKVGLNEASYRSFGLFFTMQLIPDTSDAEW